MFSGELFDGFDEEYQCPVLDEDRVFVCVCVSGRKKGRSREGEKRERRGEREREKGDFFGPRGSSLSRRVYLSSKRERERERERERTRSHETHCKKGQDKA